MKIFLRFVFAVIFMALIHQLENARSGGCGGQTYWTYENGTLIIHGSGATSDFHKTAPGWADLKSEIKHVVIEPGITYIGSYAFSYYVVESVSFPEGLIQIGDHAFEGNPITSLTLPESLEILGCSPGIEDRYSGGTFARCENLTEVTVPENLKTVTRTEFADCSNLEHVNWNAKSCTRLHFGAIEYLNYESIFKGSPVKTVNFGPNVTSIPKYLFYNMGSLTEINTCGSIEFVGERAFAMTGWIHAPDKEYEQVIYIDNVAYAFKVDNTRHDDIVIDIRPGTTCITNLIFDNVKRLERITIPESVKDIGYSAFNGCISLWEVNWNAVSLNYTSGESLFKSTGLRKLNFGPNVKELPPYMLYGCQGLTSIELPESLIRIGKSAIRDCSAITSIRIPDSVEYIDDDAFYNCKNLEMITIGNNVKTIGTSAFSALPSLKIVNWNASDVESFNASFSTNYTGSTQFTDFIVGNNVKKLPIGVCSKASYLENVVLGESLEEIPESAFNECKSLESITLPNSLLLIRNCSFSGTSLTELVIPENVSIIEGNPFSGLDLKNVFFTSIQPPSYNYSIFPNKSLRYVPDLDLYTHGIYEDYTTPYRPYAVADKTLFTSDDTNFSANFTCNIPDYSMEILDMPVLSHNEGEHSAVVEAKFSGKSEFRVRFLYKYKVEASSRVSSVTDYKTPYVVGRYNLYGHPVDADYTGIVINRYSDGSVKKEMSHMIINR